MKQFDRRKLEANRGKRQRTGRLEMAGGVGWVFQQVAFNALNEAGMDAGGWVSSKYRRAGWLAGSRSG